uniref:Dendritic cell-specific transmembrane protein-like domain-containing protein n=1 Tax=Anabas testudineus TaxID=64144 RepID=A0A3Q1JW03_ANATE
MLLPWIAAKQTLVDVGFLAVEVFTTGKRDGTKQTLVLLLICSFFSLLLSSLLLLYLIFTLNYETAVAGGIASCFGALFTVALFLSKRVRCLGTLFVISVFMKKSRNLLLTAGTSLVVLKNIRNTLENLTVLAGSMICNLKAKKASIIAPFSNYIKVLQWIESMLKRFRAADPQLVQFNSQLSVSPRVESEKLKEKLTEAERKLNETVEHVQFVMSTVSSVSSRMFPAISFLLLMLFIGLCIKKYCNDMKYKNRFIGSDFVRFDEKQREEGKPCVLPLTPEEKKLYATLTSAHPSTRERKAMLKFGAPIVSHFTVWLMIITVDALLYWFIDSIFQLSLEENRKDFSYSVTLFERECLPKPKLLLSDSICPLAAILLILLTMTLLAGKMSQVRLLVCEQFFSTAAEKRVEYLHAKILRKRLKTRKEKQHCSLKSQILKVGGAIYPQSIV